MKQVYPGNSGYGTIMAHLSGVSCIASSGLTTSASSGSGLIGRYFKVLFSLVGGYELYQWV